MTLKPGVGVHAEVTNPPTIVTSVSQNPFTPVVIKETAEKSKYTISDSSDPLPDFSGSSSGPPPTFTKFILAGPTSLTNSGATHRYIVIMEGENIDQSKGHFLWSAIGPATHEFDSHINPEANITITASPGTTGQINVIYTQGGVTKTDSLGYQFY